MKLEGKGEVGKSTGQIEVTKGRTRLDRNRLLMRGGWWNDEDEEICVDCTGGLR